MMKARDVVKRAAKGGHSASSWLVLDERGFWERRAQEMIDSSAALREQLAITDDQALEELGCRLALEALEALLTEAKRG